MGTDYGFIGTRPTAVGLSPQFGHAITTGRVLVTGQVTRLAAGFGAFRFDVNHPVWMRWQLPQTRARIHLVGTCVESVAAQRQVELCWGIGCP